MCQYVDPLKIYKYIIKTYLDFVSFLDTENVHEIEILPRGKQGRSYSVNNMVVDVGSQGISNRGNEPVPPGYPGLDTRTPFTNMAEL